uniref:Translation initiation factor 1 n=1 Tax=Cnidoscolus aconitifolius TaxID=398630 RepID=A0A8F4M7X2_9ROSI|nr:translation initiation factor 1 [Cnidoscolus aconitifolius]
MRILPGDCVKNEVSTYDQSASNF